MPNTFHHKVHQTLLIARLRSLAAKRGMRFDCLRLATDDVYARKILKQLRIFEDNDIKAYAIALHRSLFTAQQRALFATYGEDADSSTLY